jgi:hypothetical protein
VTQDAFVDLHCCNNVSASQSRSPRNRPTTSFDLTPSVVKQMLALLQPEKTAH